MSKIFSFYSKEKDGTDSEKVWFQSSNVKYSRCLDHDNQLKTLEVVFNNGSQYEYKDVNVNDYLLFREDASQGKALNKYIKAKGYEYEKLENVNIEALDDELEFRSNGGIFVFYDGENLEIKGSKDEPLLNKEVNLSRDAFDTVCASLEAVGKKLYTEGNGFEDD